MNFDPQNQQSMANWPQKLKFDGGSVTINEFVQLVMKTDDPASKVQLMQRLYALNPSLFANKTTQQQPQQQQPQQQHAKKERKRRPQASPPPPPPPPTPSLPPPSLISQQYMSIMHGGQMHPNLLQANSIPAMYMPVLRGGEASAVPYMHYGPVLWNNTSPQIQTPMQPEKSINWSVAPLGANQKVIVMPKEQRSGRTETEASRHREAPSQKVKIKFRVGGKQLSAADSIKDVPETATIIPHIEESSSEAAEWDAPPSSSEEVEAIEAPPIPPPTRVPIQAPKSVPTRLPTYSQTHTPARAPTHLPMQSPIQAQTHVPIQAPQPRKNIKISLNVNNKKTSEPVENQPIVRSSNFIQPPHTTTPSTKFSSYTTLPTVKVTSSLPTLPYPSMTPVYRPFVPGGRSKEGRPGVGQIDAPRNGQVGLEDYPRVTVMQETMPHMRMIDVRGGSMVPMGLEDDAIGLPLTREISVAPLATEHRMVTLMSTPTSDIADDFKPLENIDWDELGTLPLADGYWPLHASSQVSLSPLSILKRPYYQRMERQEKIEGNTKMARMELFKGRKRTYSASSSDESVDLSFLRDTKRRKVVDTEAIDESASALLDLTMSSQRESAYQVDHIIPDEDHFESSFDNNIQEMEEVNDKEDKDLPSKEIQEKVHDSTNETVSMYPVQEKVSSAKEIQEKVTSNDIEEDNYAKETEDNNYRNKEIEDKPYTSTETTKQGCEVEKEPVSSEEDDDEEKSRITEFAGAMQEPAEVASQTQPSMEANDPTEIQSVEIEPSQLIAEPKDEEKEAAKRNSELDEVVEAPPSPKPSTISSTTAQPTLLPTAATASTIVVPPTISSTTVATTTTSGSTSDKLPVDLTNNTGIVDMLRGFLDMEDKIKAKQEELNGMLAEYQKQRGQIEHVLNPVLQTQNRSAEEKKNSD